MSLAEACLHTRRQQRERRRDRLLADLVEGHVFLQTQNPAEAGLGYWMQAKLQP